MSGMYGQGELQQQTSRRLGRLGLGAPQRRAGGYSPMPPLLNPRPPMMGALPVGRPPQFGSLIGAQGEGTAGSPNWPPAQGYDERGLMRPPAGLPPFVQTLLAALALKGRLGAGAQRPSYGPFPR